MNDPALRMHFVVDSDWEVNWSPVPAYLCPSDPNGGVVGGTWSDRPRNRARFSYMTCWGDFVRSNLLCEADGLRSPPKRSDLFRGLYGYLRYTTIAGITDGTSNTIAFSESATSVGQNYNRVKGGVSVAGYDIDWKLSDCRSMVDQYDRTMMTGSGSKHYRGQYHAAGLLSVAGFVTVLPPNGPSCSAWSGEDAWGVFSANSYHVGGVSGALADGSVRFLGDTIDCGNSNKENTSGESPFGVWGALGTIASGETASL